MFQRGGENIDSSTAFHAPEHCFISNVYGTIRDACYDIDQVRDHLGRRRQIQIFEIQPPGKQKPADEKWRALTLTRCASAELTEQETSVKNLDIGGELKSVFLIRTRKMKR